MDKANKQAKATKSVPTKKTALPPKAKSVKPAAEKNKTEGMTYPKTSADGHAGEYLFAYWISRYFRWPCRLLDIDMGLDAQVEIYENNLSTGFFIGVQIKTTSRKMKRRLSVQIPYKNITYWGSCDFPVVIVLICLHDDNELDEPAIYWKHLDKKTISKMKDKALRSDSGCAPVTFNKDDYLSEWADKPKWVDMWLTEEDKEIIELAKRVNKTLLEIGVPLDKFGDEYGRSTYLCSPERVVPDLNSMMNEYEKINNHIRVKRRLVEFDPVVSICSQNYEKYLPKILEYFEDVVARSVGSYSIAEHFEPYCDRNHILNRIIIEKAPNSR